MDQRMTRRHFVGLGLAGVAAVGLGGRGAGAGAADAGTARLRVRPHKPTQKPQLGIYDLGLGKGGRDGMMCVPKSYDPAKPIPLVIILHGALGRNPDWIYLAKIADELGIAAVMPDSRGRDWDLMESGGFGPDIAFLDKILDHAFTRVAIDPHRIALGGFSDGASYALSVGLANGDLFTHIMAFSPGFMTPPSRTGKPKIFVAHGTRDQILPIDSSSRVLVPQLRKWGYDVTYQEFDGPHTFVVGTDRPLPGSCRAAYNWLLDLPGK